VKKEEIVAGRKVKHSETTYRESQYSTRALQSTSSEVHKTFQSSRELAEGFIADLEKEQRQLAENFGSVSRALDALVADLHADLDSANVPKLKDRSPECLRARVKLLASTKRFIACKVGEIIQDGRDDQISRCYYFSGLVSHGAKIRMALLPGVIDVQGGSGQLTVVRGDSATWDNLEPFILDQISRECRIGVYAPRQIEAGKGE